MKRILPTILATPITSSPISAESLTLTTYYPAPFGAYDRLRLVPRPTLSGTCDIGTLYVESPGELRYCMDVNGTGQWGLIKGVKNC